MKSRFGRLLFSCAVLASGAASAQTPTPDDPMGLAEGLLPGPYPTTVSGANIAVEQFVPAELNGSNQNNLKVTLPQSGPIKWTGMRFNEGDFSFNLSPGEPNNPDSYPDATFKDDYKPLDGGQPFAKTTIGWRINNAAGAALASVRVNGYNNGPQFTAPGGAAAGTLRGVAYFNSSGSGFGYKMSDGVFSNGGAGSSDLEMGVAGPNDGAGEASFSVAGAFFPYSQGWRGAWVNGGVDGPATYNGKSANLPDDVASFDAGFLGNVNLPGVNSATDGMLFVAPRDDTGNETKIAASMPSGSGWKVAIRDDADSDTTGATLPTGNAFQFLYVPYTANGLIGGHVNGDTGAIIKSAGGPRFNLTRTAAGSYSVSVLKPNGTKFIGDEGMLVMSVNDSIPTAAELPDRTFMSYEFNPGTGNFDIQVREVSDIAGGTENAFGSVLSLRDSNFYFAWVDFASPLTPNPLGDFDGDGKVDGLDLAKWKTAINVPDGTADADGDGDSDGNDFLLWQRNVGVGVPPIAGAPVPEPGTIIMILLGAVALAAAAKQIG